MNLQAAIFYTNDINAVEKFYSELGFPTAQRNGDVYLQYTFANGAGLGFLKPSSEREVVGKQTVILTVEDVKALYDKAKSLNLVIAKELTSAGWGTSFSILDVDGNKVDFVG